MLPFDDLVYMSILSHLVMGGLILLKVDLVEVPRFKGLEGLIIEETTPAVLSEGHRLVCRTRWLERKEVVLLLGRLPTRIIILWL
jgi:hypothetical protein